MIEDPKFPNNPDDDYGDFQDDGPPIGDISVFKEFFASSDTSPKMEWSLDDLMIDPVRYPKDALVQYLAVLHVLMKELGLDLPDDVIDGLTSNDVDTPQSIVFRKTLFELVNSNSKDSLVLGKVYFLISKIGQAITEMQMFIEEELKNSPDDENLQSKSYSNVRVLGILYAVRGLAYKFEQHALEDEDEEREVNVFEYLQAELDIWYEKQKGSYERDFSEVIPRLTTYYEKRIQTLSRVSPELKLSKKTVKELVKLMVDPWEVKVTEEGEIQAKINNKKLIKFIVYLKLIEKKAFR